MFIDAASGQKYLMRLWQSNGGDIKRLPEMVEEHLEWIEALPIYMTIGDTMFAHAGVLPGEDPAETIARGKLEELVWVRNPFLTKGPQFAKWSKTVKKIVHGHTITMYERDHGEVGPIVKKDRVNIDTGAFLPEGYLTAYNVTQNTFNQFDRFPQP
jgi:serine/threonine protein phosphatase 1